MSKVVRVAIGLFAAVVLMCAAAGATEYYLMNLVLNEVTARAVDHVDLAIAPLLASGVFEPPHAMEKLDELDSRLDGLLTRAREGGSAIIRLTLYARDGTILYSDLASLRGQVVSPITDPLMQAALAGSPGSALVVLGGRTTADLVERYPNALAAAVPVVLDDRVVGVYELYEDAAPAQTVRFMAWVLVGMFALTLLLLAAGVSRALSRRPPAYAAARPLHARVEHDLTRREIEVLELLATGCTYRRIGERLVISEETVRSHVKSVLHKLGAPNRARAVAAARQAGIIEG